MRAWGQEEKDLWVTVGLSAVRGSEPQPRDLAGEGRGVPCCCQGRISLRGQDGHRVTRHHRLCRCRGQRQREKGRSWRRCEGGAKRIFTVGWTSCRA